MGNFGIYELIIMVIILAVIILIPVFIYRYGKQKGRLEELERQAREKSGQNRV